MECISLRLPHLLPQKRLSSLISRRRKTGLENPSSMKAFAAKGDAYDREDYGVRGVDESMIVLRMRIHAMNMAEKKHEPPSHWMDWEKKYYPHYNSDIFEAMGLLQTLLVNTRPSLVFGIVALVVFSVPILLVMTTFLFFFS